MKEQNYIVRGQNSGVFFGQIKERNGREVTMTHCRRLYYWEGATECIQLSMEGVKYPEKCKITMYADELIILDATEIHSCTEAAARNLAEVGVWKI